MSDNLEEYENYPEVQETELERRAKIYESYEKLWQDLKLNVKFCENLLERTEALKALKEYKQKWPFNEKCEYIGIIGSRNIPTNSKTYFNYLFNIFDNYEKPYRFLIIDSLKGYTYENWKKKVN